MTLTFRNGLIFDGSNFINKHSVTISNGKIVSVQPDSSTQIHGQQYNLDGGYLVPGFIDIQVNGGGGVMFNDSPAIASLETMVQGHRQFGTTTLFPTLISTQWSVMCEAAKSVKDSISKGLAGIRGIHFEGPYLNVVRKGVHDPAIIRPVDDAALALFTEPGLGGVIVTLAPEQVDPDFIQSLSEAGVRVCAGHTDASYEQMQSAFKNGVQGITHLFNAMTQLGSREPGVVGAGLLNQQCWCGIIADGYHTHQATLKHALQSRPLAKMLLITDGMASVGSADKTFELNGEIITAVNGRCATADGTLAGSDLDMGSAVRNAINIFEVQPEEALKMASLYPAQFTGLDHIIGSIQPGYDADLVHLDKDFIPLKTWIKGR